MNCTKGITKKKKGENNITRKLHEQGTSPEPRADEYKNKTNDQLRKKKKSLITVSEITWHPIPPIAVNQAQTRK